DEGGLYTAPQTTGVYRITAASRKHPELTATATVTVVDYTLKLIAGALGGSGSLDGVGSATRFSGGGIAGEGTSLYVAHGSLRRVDLATGEVTTLTGSLSLDDAITSDGKGNLYLAGGGTIYRFGLADSRATVLARNAGSVRGIVGDDTHLY